MGFRGIRFHAGMVYGSTSWSLVVTRSCHSFTAGARHTVRTPLRSTIRRLTIQEAMVTRRLQVAVMAVRHIPRGVPPAVVIIIRLVVAAEQHRPSQTQGQI